MLYKTTNMEELIKIVNQLGFAIGMVPDPRFGTVNTYPLDVLKEIIG